MASSKNWVYRASDSDESDYDDVEQVINEEKSENGFSYKGILRLTFAFEALQDTRTNVVCSPVAALLPLGKLMLGASNKGLQELVGIIGVEHESDGDGDELQAPDVLKRLIKDLQSLPGVKLDLASRIYVSEDATVKKKFIYNTWEVFRSNVEKVSFRKSSHVVDEINGWVARQTNGAIPLILGPQHISAEASSVIVSAVYFRGKWMYPFEKIENGKFYAPSGTKTVQFMTRQGFLRYGSSSVLNAQIMEIPYKGMKSSLIIVLPNERGGLSLLLDTLKLAPTHLNKALRSMKKQLAIVTIPNFSIQSQFDLKDMFRRMGMEQLLSNSSGLTGIVRNEELKITTAVQKVVIEVKEDLATDVPKPDVDDSGPATETPDLGQIVFVANHPFLFFVKANREQLMAGTFSEP